MTPSGTCSQYLSGTCNPKFAYRPMDVTLLYLLVYSDGAGVVVVFVVVVVWHSL